jgi:hypothetical protein
MGPWEWDVGVGRGTWDTNKIAQASKTSKRTVLVKAYRGEGSFGGKTKKEKKSASILPVKPRVAILLILTHPSRRGGGATLAF